MAPLLVDRLYRLAVGPAAVNHGSRGVDKYSMETPTRIELACEDIKHRIQEFKIVHSHIWERPAPTVETVVEEPFVEPEPDRRQPRRPWLGE